MAFDVRDNQNVASQIPRQHWDTCAAQEKASATLMAGDKTQDNEISPVEHAPWSQKTSCAESHDRGDVVLSPCGI